MVVDTALALFISKHVSTNSNLHERIRHYFNHNDIPRNNYI